MLLWLTCLTQQSFHYGTHECRLTHIQNSYSHSHSTCCFAHSSSMLAQVEIKMCVRARFTASNVQGIKMFVSSTDPGFMAFTKTVKSFVYGNAIMPVLLRQNSRNYQFIDPPRLLTTTRSHYYQTEAFVYENLIHAKIHTFMLYAIPGFIFSSLKFPANSRFFHTLK